MTGARYAKSTCVVPGCARWSRRFPGEWICGTHWAFIRKSRKRALRKLWRLQMELSPQASVAEVAKIWKPERRIWEAAKREAILKAAGL